MYWDIWWSQVLELSEVRGLCIFGSLVPFLAYLYPPQQISLQLIQEILQTVIKFIQSLDDGIMTYLSFCFMLFVAEWIAAISVLLCTQHRAEDCKDMGFLSETYLAKDYDDEEDDEAYDHIGGENSNTDRIITLFMKIEDYHCFNFVPWLFSLWFYQPERGQILLGYIIVICSMLGKTVVHCRDMYFIIMDEIKKVRRKILIGEYMSECT